MYKKLLSSWYLPLVLSLSFFLILFSFVKPINLGSGFDAALGMVSFLFGFYIVFAISNTRSQHEVVMNHLKNSEGMLITIQAFSKAFEKKDQVKILKSIDDYLISTIDYKLVDYDKSHVKALELLNTLQNIKTKNAKQIAASEDAIDTIQELLNDRVKIETVLQDRITLLEWSIILGLYSIIIFFISTISIQIGFWQQNLIKAIIATALTVMLIILHKFDNYKWNESKLIWDRLTVTFNELGLIPYYPDVEIDNNNVKVINNSKIRVAHYPNEYPDMSQKEVENIVVKNTNILNG